jgi:hypothetical protein
MKLDPETFVRVTKKNREADKIPLDSIPRCVYMVSICSVKEAVIAKPHLFI